METPILRFAMSIVAQENNVEAYSVGISFSWGIPIQEEPSHQYLPRKALSSGFVIYHFPRHNPSVARNGTEAPSFSQPN